MFTNYEKLAKEMIKQLVKEPEALRSLVNLEEIKKDLHKLFLQECLDDLIKLEKAKILAEASELDFVGHMRLSVKQSIEKSVQKSINDILEVE
jgi:hypothetical protein